MNIDSDLLALRPTDEAVDAEFDSLRRAEILTAILDGPGARGDRPRHGRRTVLLIAAAAVLFAAIGGLFGDPLHRIPGGDLVPVQAQPAAAEGLDQLAERAARRTSASAPRQGQYLAVVTVAQQTGESPIRQESYTAPDGWTWRKDTERGRRTWLLYPAAADIDPTRLPTDPTELERTLRRQWLGTPSDDQGLFKLIGEIARSETAPANVRAASLEVLVTMAERPPGVIPARKGGQTEPVVTGLDGTLSGRAVVGARFEDTMRPGEEYTYWFDAVTSELVRTDQRFSDGTTFRSEVRSRAIVDQLPGDIAAKLGTDRVEKVVGQGRVL